MGAINRICSGVLLIAWMIVIYIFSDQANSNSVTEEVFGSLNYFVRKGAHMTEYAILFLLFLNFQFNCSAKKMDSRLLPRSFFAFLHLNSFRLASLVSQLALPFLLTFLYACSDEWHQSFVPGRSALISDVLIDSAGISIAALLVAMSAYRKS